MTTNKNIPAAFLTYVTRVTGHLKHSHGRDDSADLTIAYLEIIVQSYADDELPSHAARSIITAICL